MDAHGIDFGSYLSESERHEIALDEFRLAIRNALKTSNDAERFVGNVSYGAIAGVLDEALSDLGETARDVIAEKTGTIIRNLSSYSVFRDADSYLNPKPSVGQLILEEAVRENKELIKKRVHRIIGEIGRDDVRWALKQSIDDAFSQADEKEN